MTVDASPFALRAILKQKLEHSDVYKVVPYTSWSLTEVERCYSQTEHEAHAVVWGSAFLAFFPYGINFKLFIDHKALLQIYSHTSKPSVRIERWVLCLQQFDFEIKHKKGTKNPEDALLRLSIQSKIEKSCSVTNIYENFIIETRSLSKDTDKIRHETLMDDTLNLVIKAQTAKEFTEFTSLFKNFARTLHAKQHFFKEQQNPATKNLIQKGSFASTPKPLANWENLTHTRDNTGI